VTLGCEIQSWKHFEPLSLLAWEYAAALMRVTLGGFNGVTGGTDFGGSRTGSRSLRGGANNGGVSVGGELINLCCNSFLEKDAAKYPVNGGIEAGEPVVS